MEELSGVMALPEAQGPGMAPDQQAIFEQIRQNIPRQEITKELLAAGEQADPQAVAEFKQELAGLQLTPQELDQLNTMVDAILAAPKDYALLRRAYLSEGMPEDLLPEQFDPAFFAALNMAVDTIAMNPAPPPPMQMAMGGVASLAAYGRNGDTMLAHITPQEADMLKRMGGSGTINPYTGLPEFFLKGLFKSISKAFRSIGRTVKKFAKSTVGKIIIGAGLALFAGPAAASFLSTMAGGTSTLIGGFLSSTAGSAAVGGFLSGAGTTLAAGGSLKDALKAGAIGGLSGAALAGITGGANAFAARPELVNPADVAGQVSGGGLGEPSVTVNQGALPPVGTATEGIADVGSYTPGQGISYDDFMRGSIDRFNAADQRYLNQVAKEIPLDRGSLTSADLVNTPMNTGSGTYTSQGFTPADPRFGGTYVSPVERFGAEGISSSTMNAPISRAALTAPPPGGGQGIMDLVKQGEYTKALGTAYDRLMPEALGGQRGVVSGQMIDAAMPKARDMISKLYPNIPVGSAQFDKLVADQALKLATPGALSTYGPLAVAGLGAMALGGGFKPEQPQMPEAFKGPFGADLLRMYPQLYGLYYGGARPTAYGSAYTPPGYAMGGGVMDMPQAMRVGGKTYPRKTGPINGPGTGTSDSIPAMLSDGEFVFTAKAVRAMGNGSRRKGAKRMYKLMKMLEGKEA